LEITMVPLIEQLRNLAPRESSAQALARQIVEAGAKARGRKPPEKLVPGPAQDEIAATAQAIILAGKKRRGETL
jgi:hypothetical protein